MTLLLPWHRRTTIIFDRGNNWNVSLFKEALMIKKHRPSLNCGLKASKELQLFWLNFNDFIRLLIYSFNIKFIYSFFNVLIILVDEILVQILVISIQKALCIVLLWCLSVYLEHAFVKMRFAFILILLFYVLTVNNFYSYWWWICNKFGNFTQSTLLSYFLPKY